MSNRLVFLEGKEIPSLETLIRGFIFLVAFLVDMYYLNIITVCDMHVQEPAFKSVELVLS